MVKSYSLRGRTLTTKWLLWTTSNHHILGSPTSLGLNFDLVCSVKGCFNFLGSQPYFESHMTRISKPLKLDSLHVTLIKTMPTVKEPSDAKSVVRIS